MKFILLATLLIGALVTAIEAQSQDTNSSSQTTAQLQAKKELRDAAASYREGNFADAQSHSEKALALDPANKEAPFFIARTLHAQYKPGITDQANVAKAHETVAAYQRILAQFPDNDEAYKAIAYLYGSLKEEQVLRDWISMRASDVSVDPAKRAEAYIVLASKDWDCSYKITELPSNKSSEVNGKKLTLKYIKPADQSEFEKAKQCARSGLQMAEMAIALTPDDESAWSYKTNLLLEMSKLAEMANDEGEKATLIKDYEEALRQTTVLSERHKKQQP